MVKISEQLTEQKLLEILLDSYHKGQLIENIKAVELVEDMKQKVLLVMNNEGFHKES